MPALPAHTHACARTRMRTHAHRSGFRPRQLRRSDAAALRAHAQTRTLWFGGVRQDELCRCLLINSRSPNLKILSLALRVV